jgi:hypothetical protein
MAKTHRPRQRDSKDGHDSGAPYDKEPNDREEHDDPREHREIEQRRFIGGEPPTAELYARARAQWSRLPGALARPSTSTPQDETPHEGPTPPTTDKKHGQGGDL